MTWSGRDALLQRWLPRFASRDRLEMSISRYLEKSYALDDQRADEWVQRDHVRDAELASVGLSESHPSTYTPSPATLDEAIIRGDLHDFRQDLDAPTHESICPRCQLGVRSRQLVDELAARMGKTPFPGFGDVLERGFAQRRRRCDECDEWEDAPAPDSCEKSFWHLPDIFLALHPDQTLDDMGQLGPFMRGFLRRQRPARETS